MVVSIWFCGSFLINLCILGCLAVVCVFDSFWALCLSLVCLFVCYFLILIFFIFLYILCVVMCLHDGQVGSLPPLGATNLAGEPTGTYLKYTYFCIFHLLLIFNFIFYLFIINFYFSFLYFIYII